MLALLRRRNFALLWFGQLISQIGDYVRMIALPFYVYELTGSALASGAMFMAQMLPPLIFGSLAGVFVDRWNRKRTMIVSNLLRAGCLLPLLAVTSQETLWILYAIAFALSLISLVFRPAKIALIPRLVGEKNLVAANALDGISENLARLIGPSLGGALLGLTGLTSVVLIDAASYVVSAVCIVFILVPSETPQAAAASAAGPAGKARPGIGKQWLQGIKLLTGSGSLAALFIVLGIATVADNIITVLIVPFVKDILESGALGFGGLLSVRGLGGLLGGLLVGQVGKKIPPTRLLPLGLILSGVIFAVFIYSRSLVLSAILLFLIGVPAMAWMVSTTTLIQKLTPDQYRGRILGTYSTILSLTALAGMALAGVLGDATGTLPILTVACVLFFVAGGVGLALLRPAAAESEGAPGPAAAPGPTGEAPSPEEKALAVEQA